MNNNSSVRFIGRSMFKLIEYFPYIHTKLSNSIISNYADKGPVPGVYTTEKDGLTSLRELLDKHYFALEVPKPTQDKVDALPPIDEVLSLFQRKGKEKTNRVSLLLPFFAQHLTDAVFQSKNSYETNAPHEIILNQIYGNTPSDEAVLREKDDGLLKTQEIDFNGLKTVFPPSLCEKDKDNNEWKVKAEFQNLSYLQNPEKITVLLERYKGREEYLCATGLFQGNLTLGNFAISTLLLREHNRIAGKVKEELESKKSEISSDIIFKKAQQINITCYMKVVIEDYINAFAGQKIFKLDTSSFFYEKKSWFRESPIPYHFNILYRMHGMIPDTLNGFEEKGFSAFLANNDTVMKKGIAAIFNIACSQAAAAVCLGNVSAALIPAERAMLEKARAVLASFNAHKEAQQKNSSLTFEQFDPEFRSQLEKIYQNVDKVEYAVGIFAERPKSGMAEYLGFKEAPIIGATLMDAIAKHAFRHILSNRYMSREFLNSEVMTEFGWKTLHDTSTVSDLLKRNVPELNQQEIDDLNITF